MSESPMEAFAAGLGVETVVDHSRCHPGTCQRMQVCPLCRARTFVRSWHGRWDQSCNDGRGATAIPFDPVAITLDCGCVHGDITAAQPAPSSTTEKLT